MNHSKQHSERREALVENIGKREELPRGWRGIYDQLIVDLYKVQPDLRVESARAKLGQLRVYLERHPAPGKEPGMLITRATAASRAACEVCGQAAREHTVSEVFGACARRTCERRRRRKLRGSRYSMGTGRTPSAGCKPAPSTWAKHPRIARRGHRRARRPDHGRSHRRRGVFLKFSAAVETLRRSAGTSLKYVPE